MDKLKILKILMQIFITNPSARLAWNVAVITIGFGSAYMFFIMDPNASAISYSALIGPLIIGMGIISFVIFTRLFFSLVLINFFRFAFSKAGITEYIDSYGYYPSNKLKKHLKQIEKSLEQELKDIEKSGLSSANTYGVKEKYESMKIAAQAEDKRNHIESCGTFRWTPLYFYWWSSRPWRWSVYIFFIINIASTHYMSKNTPFTIWKSSIGLNLSLLYASLVGAVFLMLYSVFRINIGDTPEHGIARTVKAIAIFFIGMTVGFFVFNYTITGFINEQFGTEKTFEVTAKYWRQSANWCHGLEVHYYDVPKFFYSPDMDHGAYIICFPESYKNTFDKDSVLLAHGSGTILGINIKEISSPANHVERMPSPKWD